MKVVAVVALVAQLAAAATACEAETGEGACEARAGCYWASHLSPAACRAVPTNSTGCTCTLDSCSLLNSGPAGGGCEPRRFCVPVSAAPNGCGVVAVSTDLDCKEDGISTCQCVPSEFCTRAPQWDESGCFASFTSVNCFMRRDTGTPAPTGSDRPTPSPVRFTLPSPPPSPEPGLSMASIAGIAGGGGGVLFLGLVLYACSRRESDAQPKGLITPEEYLDHAPPRVPALRPLRRAGASSLEGLEGMRLEVAFDFEGENDDELTAKTGDMLLGLLRYDEWWEARDTLGNEGIIPCAFVTELGLTDGVLDEAALNVGDGGVDF